MLAGLRFCFLFSFLLAFSAATCLPVQAQINGVPASVTSFGFGGSNNPNPGVRASVTSLGPNGYGDSRPVFGNCCANFFMPANPNPPLFFNRQSSDRQSSDRHSLDRRSSRHRHREDGTFFPVGIAMPAYIPYAMPDTEEADEDSPDEDPAYSQTPRKGPRRTDSPTAGVRGHDSTPKAVASAPAFAAEPEQPVTPQPSTVLVFKDGHHSDVLNYAIVEDTLFDFGAGRTRKIRLADLDLPATRKANDEQGVDFQIPASSKQQ